jgi:serine/threonine protein kinase/tetratricopeptide (TPR) repeat protein
MSRANADRNLLFGILALQMDFVTRDQLIAAMNAWVLDKARPLGEILEGQGALPCDTHVLLEALVQKHLELHGNDPERSLAAVSSLGPAREELRRIADPELHASLAHVASACQAEEDPYATREPSVGRPTLPGLRYRILRPHARGGLGEVFVARDEELHREVALKQIQDQHADNPEGRGRFLLEAEITGGLEHPGIVPVYGLGHYADGRPFYAMRFIRGDSLKNAIERFHQANVPGRDPSARAVEFRQLLGRFLDVCNAIAYAHSRGVLHRDLKPGNVMLGKYGETLVVDWGLAKPLGRPDVSTPPGEEALRPALASGSVETLPGSALGTPQYISPEQAAGRLEQLGPASDVYSLGATLYCLLTGQVPFPDPHGGGVEEVLQRVQRGEFPPPRKVHRQVPPALEAVCVKAMALRPGDRYASPRALADDIEHWLADEPVSAFREPLRTRVARWGRRHKTLVKGAAVLLVTAVAALATGLVLLGKKQREVVQERNTAQRARDKAEAINKFLVEDLLAAARPEDLGKDVPMRKVLDKAAEKVETSFPDQPEVEAAVRLAIGDSYQRLDLHADAEPHLRRAVELRREVLGPEHPDTLKAIDSLAMLFGYAGKYAEAEPLFRDTLEARRRLLGPEHADTLWSLHNWAWWLHLQGKWAEAEPLYRECLEARRRIVGPDKRETLMTAHNLAQVVYNQGRLDEAEQLHRENLEARRRALGPEHPHTLMSMNDLAMALQDRKELDEAEKIYHQTLEIERRVYGPEHRETLTTMNDLASLLEERGKPKEAEPLYRQVWEIRKRVLGPDHPDTIQSKDFLASSCIDEGKLAEAEELYREIQEARRRVQGPEHPATLLNMAILGRILSRNGKRDEAEGLLRQRIDILKRVRGPDHADTLLATHNLVQMLMSHGKLEEAEALGRQNLEARRRALGPEDTATLVSMEDLAVLLQDRGKREEAETLLRETVEIRRRVTGPEHKKTLNAITNLAWLLSDEKKTEEAERLYRETVEIKARTQGGEHPDTLSSRSSLAYMLADHDELDEAQRTYREILEIQRRVLGPEHDDTLSSMSALGLVLADLDKPDEAEPLLREVLRVRRKNLPPGHQDFVGTLAGLGRVLTLKGQAKEAEPLLRECSVIQHKTSREGNWSLASVESLLGGCLTAQARYEEAEPLLLRGYENLKNAKGEPAPPGACGRRWTESSGSTKPVASRSKPPSGGPSGRKRRNRAKAGEASSLGGAKGLDCRVGSRSAQPPTSQAAAPAAGRVIFSPPETLASFAFPTSNTNSRAPIISSGTGSRTVRGPSAFDTATSTRSFGVLLRKTQTSLSAKRVTRSPRRSASLPFLTLTHALQCPIRPASLAVRPSSSNAECLSPANPPGKSCRLSGSLPPAMPISSP